MFFFSRLYIPLFVFVFFFIGSASASAASLYLSPPTGVYTAGNTFTVRIMVDTQNEAVNAAEGTLSFNPKDLSVISLGQGGSIFNLWTVDPSFSNSQGTVSFGGGSPKGYTGKAGQILTVTFRALRESQTSVTFSSGVILAADGQGTNVISSMQSGSYTISSATITPAPEYVAPDNTPSAPSVTSSLPDQNKWYATSTAVFSWTVPGDVTEMRTAFDDKPGTIPTVYYATPIKERTIQDIEDGVWYFHIQFKNKNGWGKITHHRLRIDTQNPTSLEIQEGEADATDPAKKFIFIADDDTSGVQQYEIQIGNQEPVLWNDDGSHTYTIPDLPPGKYNLLVKALDGAGNYIVNTAQFEIESLAPPLFTEYQDILNTGSIIVVRGTTYPNATVKVFLENEAREIKEFTLASDENGAFTFIDDKKAENGVYKVFAEVTDARGAKSNKSETITLAVEKSKILKFGSTVLSVVSVIVPLIGTIFLLGVSIVYTRYRFTRLRRRLDKEIREAETALEENFVALRSEVKKNIDILEHAKGKRGLTEEEEMIAEGLKKRLLDAEKTVRKEIRDIRREIM